MKILWHPSQWLRFWRILFAVLNMILQPQVLKPFGAWSKLSYLNPGAWANRNRGAAVRKSLTNLGPIFVKFGQLLSTRRDVLPEDVADELAKLQDKVPPFSGKLALKIVCRALMPRGSKINPTTDITNFFEMFDTTALASASIAQVHAARLPTGEEVVVKVLRPKLRHLIKRDVELMHFVANILLKLSKHARRLRLGEVVAEFERVITDELDFMREAANAVQLKRNFKDNNLLKVPDIYWNLTRQNVMVSERVYGLGVSDLAKMRAANTDLKLLSERGVEIFFTQVFRDCFFHADMHPGNIFVDITDPKDPTYLGVDFGIMGTLSPNDQYYLAENLLAFFHRDYQRVAILHVESGWVPPTTRVDELEGAIRAVCEPIFAQPLKNISFAEFLLRLFKTAERFDMQVQPQLLLLQKTLVNVEGLGRQLYPDLDLWATAKPILEKFVRRERGAIARLKNCLCALPQNIEALSDLPVLLQKFLSNKPAAIASAPKRVRLRFISGLVVGFAFFYLVAHFYGLG